MLGRLLLFILPTARPCVVKTDGLSFSLELGPTVFEYGGFSYAFDACLELPMNTLGCASPAPIVQRDSLGNCVALGARDGLHVRVWSGRRGKKGIGVEFLFGAAAGGCKRTTRLVVACDPSGGSAALPRFSALEPRTCEYNLTVFTGAGCPAECPRSAGGAVCGGRERGACVLGPDGSGARCECALGRAGVSCEDDGTALALPPAEETGLPRVLLASLAAVLGLALVFDFACEARCAATAKPPTPSVPSNPLCRRVLLLTAAVALLFCYATLTEGALLVPRLAGATGEFAKVGAQSTRPPPSLGLQLCGPGGAGVAAATSAPMLPPTDDGSAAAPVPGVVNRFSEIYHKNLWGGSNGIVEGGGSGMGSTLEATETTRVVIEMLVYRYGVRSLLDAPCGSSHWWPPLLQSIREVIPCFRYHGVDVVESVIAASQEQWAADELTTFAVADVSQQPLGASYDLVLCRDALQHLPLGLAGKVLANIAATNSRLLLVGSYYLEGENNNVPIGDYYPVNVVKWPFLLPEPEAVFAEKVPGTGPPSNQGRKFLLLYTREQLATVDWVELKLRCEKEQRVRAARRER